MYTLFIDTHFKDVKLGLYRDEKLLKIREATEFPSTSQTVLPMIRSILKDISILLEYSNLYY